MHFSLIIVGAGDVRRGGEAGRRRSALGPPRPSSSSLLPHPPSALPSLPEHHSDASHRPLQFGDDDPYAGELNAFLDEIPATAAGAPAAHNDSAIADDDESPAFAILSSFADASKTYALSWAIRLASEANTTKFSKKEKK